jgi:hypothetical protein
MGGGEMRSALAALAVWLAASTVVLGPAGPAAAQTADAVGVVAALEGSAAVHRRDGGDAVPLAVKAPMYSGDTVRTASGSKLRLTFRDGTAVSLGADSTFRVAEFATGAAARPSMAVQLTSGVMRFVTQLLPDSSYTVRTRVAVAAVRGTDLLVRITEGCEFYVVRGKVSVAHEGFAGAVELTEGLGTAVQTDRAPTPAARWATDRVERLIRDSTVE